MDTDSSGTDLGGAVRAGAPARGAPTVPRPREGGGSGITHLCNRQTQAEAPCETGGEDTVHLALNVYWRDDFDGLMEGLEAAQEQAQNARGLARYCRGGHEFAVGRKGIKSGGGRGRYFRYALRHLETGTLLKLTDASQSFDQSPNVLLELGSVFLTASGGIGPAWAECKNLLEALGGYVLWDKLSRVDLCADFPGWEMGTLHDLIVNQGLAITRARSRACYQEHNRETGIAFGTGNISLRIYDKAFEVCTKKPDAVKRQLLEKLRWGGPQDSAVRVEYQLRRPALKGWHIDGLSQYNRMRADISGYLTSEWFRIAAHAPDRANNNTQRAEVHPLWLSVQEGFANWAGQPVQHLRRDRVRTKKDPIRLVKQAQGCLLTAVAELESAPAADREELLQKLGECLTWNAERIGEVDLLRRYEQKRLERGSRGG